MITVRDEPRGSAFHPCRWRSEAGRRHGPLERLERAIQLDPTYAPAYSNLGNVYRERGQIDQAIAQYQKAISMDPDYWIAHQNLGVVYKQQGRVGEAVREFKLATRLSLRSPGAGEGGPARTGGRRVGCLGSGGMMLVGLLGLGFLRR